MNCKHIGFIEEIGVAKTYPPNGQSLMEYYLLINPLTQELEIKWYSPIADL